MVFIHLQFFFEIVRADIYGVQIWSIDHESLQFAIDGMEKENGSPVGFIYILYCLEVKRHDV